MGESRILALDISVLGWYGDHGGHHDCDGHSEERTLVGTTDIIRTHLHTLQRSKVTRISYSTVHPPSMLMS